MSSFKDHPKPGVLVLEDPHHPEGILFPGFLFGAAVSAKNLSQGKDHGYGEVVFNTSLTGYQEILTDPSYYGQIICMTTPHIGNTGVNLEDPESAHPWCAGFVVHEAADTPSNWRSMGTLDAYLKKYEIPAIYGVDTRALTRHLRSRGVVRGLILPEDEKLQAKELLKKLPPFEGRDLIGEVSTRETYRWPLDPSLQGKGKYKVVAIDYGLKWNLLRSLHQLGCDVEVVPAHTSAKVILDKKPNGVFLSNGPGDPAAAPYATQTVRELLGQVPIFGVCMGHQILSLACGAKTFKLKFGHRGGNQPVLDRDTGKVEISSQNHGYAVDDKTLPANMEVTHINLNDKTVEGIRVKDKKAFSVQYHPESCPGPHDSIQLFDRFIALMEQK
jgi:carbamoyl-phosphate synthase small subunit